jgi:quercetin dioxygenase-like cupin family protein
MDFFPAGSRAAVRGAADRFTGTVWQDPIHSAEDPARLRALRVFFEPGARTAWHSHPLGQILHITGGIGLVGRRNQPPQLVRPGDSIWISPTEEHWHGAAPGSCMEHIAMHEAQNGFVATWMELVSDEDYLLSPA